MRRTGGQAARRGIVIDDDGCKRRRRRPPLDQRQLCVLDLPRPLLSIAEASASSTRIEAALRAVVSTRPRAARVLLRGGSEHQPSSMRGKARPPQSATPGALSSPSRRCLSRAAFSPFAVYWRDESKARSTRETRRRRESSSLQEHRGLAPPPLRERERERERGRSRRDSCLFEIALSLSLSLLEPGPSRRGLQWPALCFLFGTRSCLISSRSSCTWRTEKRTRSTALPWPTD